MKFSYYAIFEPENTGFWLYFPELTGCHTCGYDFEHAKKMAKEFAETDFCLIFAPLLE